MADAAFPWTLPNATPPSYLAPAAPAAPEMEPGAQYNTPAAPTVNPAGADHLTVTSTSRLPLLLTLLGGGLLAWYFIRKSNHSNASEGGSTTATRRRGRRSRSRRTTVRARARKSGRFVKRRKSRSRRKTVTWAR